ncbi:MAG TPA: choice-of-anchor R domain-containing protein [Candidatus Paceibacterota bacterium]|nr:choice-of-anchor R domain-containing protein [Verrucomicrobiota bacterium]HSA12465.1 choice-of-anchor R domain-containing protein [Candidatus Paceibacterota bacterium]
MKALRATLSAFALFLLGAPSLQATTVASNLDRPYVGFYRSVTSGEWAATSFTTGNQPAVLHAASLELFAQGGTATFVLDLRQNAIAFPGTELGQFLNTPSTSSSSAVLLTFASAFTLQPNTTYWLALTATSGTGAWLQTSVGPPDTWAINALAYSPDDGTAWEGPFAQAGYLSLEATIIPEPSACALLGAATAGLACVRRKLRRSAAPAAGKRKKGSDHSLVRFPHR